MPAVSRADDVLRRHRFTIADVDRMAEVGILEPDDRVELLDGELVDVSPQGPEHAWAGDGLHELLRAAYGSGFRVRNQRPLELGPSSRPEPDLAVVRGGHDDFKHAHPRGCDTVLVVEVAFSSQAIDREKARVYAAGGVPVYWLLDVAHGALVVHAEPTPAGYGAVVTLDERADVALPLVGVSVRVRNLLP
jgi:Uma2 family endonuclease